MPVQAYFRMDSENMGQFEHTLIIAEKNSEVHYIEGCSAPQYASTNLHAGGVEVFVGEDAHVQYSTIQNWSKNTYNLNTKRALVDSNGTMEWVSGSLGSKATMLYPSSVLKGEGASDNHITIAFAGEGQDIDTGAKVYHNAPRTTSTIESKSISKNGGRTNYRGLVHIANGAKDSSTAVECFPRGTPIYTSSGFKPIEDIEIDEYVMTHKGRFQPVQEVIRNKPKDDMIEIDVAGSGEKLVLTNSHPVLADTRDNYPRKNANFNLNWIEAEELREHDYMAVPRPELDENFTKFEQLNKSYGNKYSKELQLDNITLRRLCRFIGYYIAEGCTDERGQRVHFSFNSSEEEYISEVEEVIQDIGLNVSVRSDKDNCTEVFTDSIALADYMKRFGKRHNEKTIPSDYMNEECLRHIIPTMYYGDGTLSRDDSSRIHYTTASADLARSLRLALSYFGIGCVENIKRQAGRKPAYIVDISGKSTEEFLNKFDIKGFSVSEIDEDRRCMEITEDYIIYPIRDVSRVEYNEEVYNLDVKSDSSYTANLYAVHNCDALMFDNESTSDTMPFMEIKENDVDVAHEATVGKIGDEDVFYLQSRGLDDDDAKQMIVNGFIEPLTEELPIEYAVELNRLIELEMEGSLG
jgi:Fe-S cluster assembly scaffold protein SufB